MAIGTLGLAFLAGLLSILSPCVLPLLPIVLGTAASEHRGGPFALAGGVALSFVAIGLFVATVGFTIGLNGEVFRTAAAILMIGVGVLLAMPTLQVRRRPPAAQLATGLTSGSTPSSRAGSPDNSASACSLARLEPLRRANPRRGLPSGSAGLVPRSGHLDHARFRHWRGGAPRRNRTRIPPGHGRWRDRLITSGKGAKIALGVLLVVLGAMIVSGFNKRLETVLVDWSPQWLTDLTTRF